MPENSSPVESSIALALLPGQGMVRTCPSGCLHVTWGCITLDFRRRDLFQQLVESVGRQEPAAEPVQVQYGPAVLCFTPPDFQAFAGMLAVASEHLEHLHVVRRLLSS